jgi:hypothetical protein
MTTITADGDFLNRLLDVKDEAVPVDESGEVLGRFFAMPQPVATAKTASGQEIMMMPEIAAPEE